MAASSDSLDLSQLRVYLILDTISRYRRMTGNDLQHPAEIDAFGFSAEDKLTREGIVETREGLQKVRKQLKDLNVDSNWALVCYVRFHG